MNATTVPNVKPEAVISRRSLDQLEQDIVSLSQHINASECEFLVLLREFDLRQGWKAYHFNNCAEWLNMKCGISPRTAREKLRVASALFDLPEIAQAFQKGDFSYSKARALTRVANAKTEAHLLDFALKANAAHVDRHCFELRNAQRTVSTRDANRINNRRYLSYVPSTDGSVCISLELPKETADLVLKALELAAAQLKPADAEYLENGCTSSELSEIDEGGSREPSVLQQQQVDALVEMARGYLAGSDSVESDGSRTSCTADHYQVTVHVDERALRGATTPENLVMLCSAHHRLLHEGGLEIKAGPDGRWQFRRLATP